MHVVQIHHPDGSLSQVFTTTEAELRTVLNASLVSIDAGTRSRTIGRSLSGLELLRTVDAGHGRTVSVLDQSKAYRRSMTTARHDDGLQLESRKYTSGPLTGRRSASTNPTLRGGTGSTMDGYAVIWDAEYPISDRLGTYTESMSRGAFTRSLREITPTAHFDHGAHPLLGSIPITKYDVVVEDERGLRVRGELSDSWLIAPVVEAIRDGRITGMSIRFAVRSETWSRSRDRRTIIEAFLYEAGPVVSPASPSTSVGIRTTRTTPRSRAQRRAVTATILGGRS